MNSLTHSTVAKGGRLGLAMLGGLVLLAAVVLLLNVNTLKVHADPIPPAEGGYPKFNTSVKTVTPTLASTGGVTLTYTIELRNTGAFTATGTSLTDLLPQGTTYNSDAQSDVFSCTPGLGTLNCLGEVGFDSTAVVTFSVWVDPAFSSPPPLVNTVVISHPLMAEPVTKTAETVITDVPLLTVEKSSLPAKPGVGKPLTYTLAVANWGQPATDLLVTVVDHVPADTSLIYTGTDGIASPAHDVITWTRSVTLGTGETTYFDFAVEVGPVPSGTVITNDDYWASWLETEETGEPYTVTVVTPIFHLFKEVWPDPPGSNREMTYQLTVLNSGSLATGLVITDVVPAGVDDVGGLYPSPDDVVSWNWPSLDTDESAEFTFTVYISDVMEVPIVNQDYGVCSAEEICLMGEVLTSVVKGPNFVTAVWHDPIAKKPGGGPDLGPVTPTLVVHNLGPGNAIDVQATLYFTRISVSEGDLLAIPDIGIGFPDGPDCGDKCVSYVWVGDLNVGDVVTFTTNGGQSTIGGEEGLFYTSTVVVIDTLANTTTIPFIGAADGRITHYAYLVPTKSAPRVIGPGQLMTYTLHVENSALSTDEPPSPWLTDSVPLSTTVVRISDGGISRTLTGTAIVSWTLPPISTGDDLYRSYTVRVNEDLVSGTKIVNSDYWVYWHEAEITTTMYLSNTGPSITTTVREVGLIDSYKEVTPTVVRPGPGNLLTYTLHIVNSGPYSLSDVTVYDLLPWQFSTYLRDAVVSAGELVSDIVSLHWTGSVEAFSSELITFTVLIDEDFQGVITNTAVISHADLAQEVVIGTVAYVTDKPVFAVAKRATPDPVERGAELNYEITVWNLGQRATGLVITDAIPINAPYVPGSANLQGTLVGDDLLRWQIPTMDTGESRTFRFRVTVGEGEQVINELYGVQANGVLEMGPPVYTTISRGRRVYLPLVVRQ